MGAGEGLQHCPSSTREIMVRIVNGSGLLWELETWTVEKEILNQHSQPADLHRLDSLPAAQCDVKLVLYHLESVIFAAGLPGSVLSGRSNIHDCMEDQSTLSWKHTDLIQVSVVSV